MGGLEPRAFTGDSCVNLYFGRLVPTQTRDVSDTERPLCTLTLPSAAPLDISLCNGLWLTLKLWQSKTDIGRCGRGRSEGRGGRGDACTHLLGLRGDASGALYLCGGSCAVHRLGGPPCSSFGEDLVRSILRSSLH